MSEKLKNVLIISSNPDERQLVSETLKSSRNYTSTLEIDTDKLLTSLEVASHFDMVIMIEDDFDKHCLSLLHKLNLSSQLPVLVFTQTDDEEMLSQAIASGVSAYVIDGLKKERIISLLQVASARFELSRKTQLELDQNKQALVDRKRIDRAKGLLMTKRNMSEETAYKTLRDMAMNQNKKIADVAENLIYMIELI